MKPRTKFEQEQAINGERLSECAQGQIEVSHVSVSYKSSSRLASLVLSPTSFTLKPGTFGTLIGPSGCGKSTLLNVVAGFVSPSTGNVTVDGRRITKPNPDIGVVFQNFALFPWLSAIENVKFPLKRFSMSRIDQHSRAMSALEEVGLAEHAHKYPRQLSGGMKQRVAIARTLVSDPTVLLMDEPFGALDAQTRLSMQELLLTLWERRQKTVLFVTHDVDEALRLADVIFIMSTEPGRIVERIDVEIERPRSVDRFCPKLIALRTQILDLLHHKRDEVDLKGTI